MNNAQIEAFKARIAKIEALPRIPGKTRRICAGSYVWKAPDGAIWNVCHNEELNGDCKWIAYGKDAYDYTDPFLTKAELIEALEGN